MKVMARQMLDRGIQRRYHAGHRHALRLQRDRQPGGLQQDVQQDTMLVGRALGVGRDASVMDQFFVIVDADYGVGIADVDCDQHG